MIAVRLGVGLGVRPTSSSALAFVNPLDPVVASGRVVLRSPQGPTRRGRPVAPERTAEAEPDGRPEADP